MASLRKYRIEITGTQPLLMHADNIGWADEMDKWKAQKDNKKSSKAGDDRSPAWKWLGCLYHDGKHIMIPTENIMRCLMEAGAMVPVPGTARKTFKSQTQSGIMPTAIGWNLLLKGEPIPYEPLADLMDERDFGKHEEVAKKMGFELFLKRAKIGKSKHVRVRPCFQQWQAIGELLVTDEQITEAIFNDILDSAGRYKGIGDWRPGGATPGSYGMFRPAFEQVN